MSIYQEAAAMLQKTAICYFSGMSCNPNLSSPVEHDRDQSWTSGCMRGIHTASDVNLYGFNSPQLAV